MPRSQLFAEALASYLEVHGSKAITAALNDIYADEKSGLDQEWQHAQSGVLENETW